MTNANPFRRIKSDLAHLSNSLQSNKLQANTLNSSLSPFGLGKQTAVGSPQSLAFRPSI